LRLDHSGGEHGRGRLPKMSPARWRRRSCQSVATRTSGRRLSDRQQHGSVPLLRDRAVAKAVVSSATPKGGRAVVSGGIERRLLNA
jgi:hypothetical protein